ncbi:hypothetical protein ACHHYP_20711 [Achlya hypogyna]|uniref:Uncharacterized protein n=1 Tax=Achlya hypogyna TaxID=1202772 RepID=A0A1V9YE46_ACHHY|nr:hypothetical protein ACHHYP_20711 [Achlya hypogyna]
MSKGFAYVFNTTKEDERVAKVLSGHRANATDAVLDFSTFDDATRVELDLFRETMYQTCLGFSDQRYNVPLRLLETITAYLIRSYPVLRNMSAQAPIVSAMERAMTYLGLGAERLVAWATHLCAAPSSSIDSPSSESCTDAAVVCGLVKAQEQLLARIRQLEQTLYSNTRAQKATKSAPHVTSVDAGKQAATKQRRKTSLADHWYMWYASQPPLCVVSFMRLFAEDDISWTHRRARTDRR